MKNVLLWLGSVMVVGGSVVALLVKAAADARAQSSNLRGASMGYEWDFVPDYTGMLMPVVVAAAGVVAILVHVVRRLPPFRRFDANHSL